MQTANARSYAAIFDSPVGRLGIRLDSDGRVCEIDNLFSERLEAAGDTAAQEVVSALAAYFANSAKAAKACTTAVDLAPTGTDYQRRVWKALCAIPRGEVRTYAELASELGTGPRAVGQACRRNPIPILIPCHRVVSCKGVGGYAGANAGRWLAVKQWLLHHEGIDAFSR